MKDNKPSTKMERKGFKPSIQLAHTLDYKSDNLIHSAIFLNWKKKITILYYTKNA